MKLILTGFCGILSDASQAQEPVKDEKDEEEITDELSSLILVLQTDEHEDEEEELLGNTIGTHEEQYTQYLYYCVCTIN